MADLAGFLVLWLGEVRLRNAFFFLLAGHDPGFELGASSGLFPVKHLLLFQRHIKLLLHLIQPR